MPDEVDPKPQPLTARNVWEAIDHLRDETREARHHQANLTQRAIIDLDARLDARLRIIEQTMAQANPVSLGPRINALEMWRAIADGDTTLAGRVNALEAWRDELRGSLTFLKATGVVLGVLSSAAAILSWLSLNRPMT